MADSPPPVHTQRRVGGLWCAEVLELLPDYLDGSLSVDDRAAAEAHLAACSWCSEFGGRYAATVAALQGALKTREPDAQVLDRLHQRLRRET